MASYLMGGRHYIHIMLKHKFSLSLELNDSFWNVPEHQGGTIRVLQG